MTEILLSQDLYKKITIITIGKGIVVGEITRLQKGNFVVKVLHQKNVVQIDHEQPVLMQIELSEQGENYNYTGEVVSVHSFDKEKLIFIKPLTLKKEKNRRQSKRVSMAALFEKTIHLNIRHFPPIDKNWNKADIIDISEGGVKLALKEYYNDKQLVEIILHEPFLKEKEILLCQIVHRKREEKNGYSYSIHFLNMNEKHSEELERFVIGAIKGMENKK